MTAAEPALLRAFPRLTRLPRLPLLTGPTPVEPFPVPGTGTDALWVKREDRSCPAYGGNKPRKLEFLLGNALDRGCRRVVTAGGLGTNHGLATTVLGRAAGLATTLVLIDQPMTPLVRETLLLQAAWGAEQLYGGNIPFAAVEALRALGRSAWRGERPQVVATGGSSWRGNIGFVAAALELAEQVRAGECPSPDELYVAVGTGGTAAGLAAGFALARLPVRVVGVLVSDILPPSRRALVGAARQVLRRLRRVDPSLPDVSVTPDAVELVTRQRGAGYGAPTPAGIDAVTAARTCGLSLEPTYTGKCLAEIRARGAEGALGPGPALYWHTYNAVDVRATAPQPLDARRLPPRLRAKIAEIPP